ncbi:MAG: stalk domain-containing protein, partial [Acidobacteriota bacterium]
MSRRILGVISLLVLVLFLFNGLAMGVNSNVENSRFDVNNLRATSVSADGVELVWNGYDQGRKGFLVYRLNLYQPNAIALDGVIIGEVNGTSFTDTAFLPATNYYYWVVSKETGISTNTITVKTDRFYWQNQPTQDSPISAWASPGASLSKLRPQCKAVSDSQVMISWERLANISSLEIYRGCTKRSGDKVLLAKRGANPPGHYWDVKLENNTWYTYKIVAYMANGEQTQDTVDVRTLLPRDCAPNGPINSHDLALKVEPVSNTETELSWRVSPEIIRVELYRSNNLLKDFAGQMPTKYRDPNLCLDNVCTYKLRATTNLGEYIEQQVEIRTPATLIKMYAGSNNCFINGKQKKTAVPTLSKNRKAMIPLATIANGSGAVYAWNKANNKAVFL